MSIKVLFISSWYPNPGDRTHGIFVKRYAEAVALFNDVAVIHIFGDESYSEKVRIESRTENRVHEIYVYYKKKKTDPLSKFRSYQKHYMMGLNLLVKEWGKPDIIQVNVVFPAAVAAIPIIKKLNVPYIISEHWTGYHPEDGSYKGLIKQYFTKRLVKKAKAIVTVTGHLKRSMMLHGLNGDYQVIPNVVNDEIFKFNAGLERKKFRFLHVSSLDRKQKNVEGIICAFKELVQTGESCELVIAGDGENRVKLEQLAGELLNKSVFFTGNKFGSDLSKLYNGADCFVLFSNFENLPVVLLEAQCCGLPVITTDVGGIKEFLDQPEVLFLRPGDNSALFNAMKKMRDEFGQPDRKRISETASQKFGYQTIGKKFTGIYKRIIHQHE